MRISKTFLGMSSFVVFAIAWSLLALGLSEYFKKEQNFFALLFGYILGVLSFILFLITLVRLFVNEN